MAAVISGCGAVSPFGCGVPAFWAGLLRGGSALRDSSFAGGAAKAGEVPDFDAERELGNELASRLDRITQFAVVAAREALRDADLDLAEIDPSRVGVILGTTLGGMQIGEDYRRAKHSGTGFAARQLLHFPYYAVANRLARELDVRGPVISPSIACASGTHAVGLALELIRRGQADVFIAGGAEALCDFVVSGFACLRATTREAVRPFDARRDGLGLGEGAAVLIVESGDSARRREKHADVEVVSAGLAGDASHMTAPARDGAGAIRAMRAALDDAGVGGDVVDFISAHGTGTVYNDAMEIAAISTLFGEGAAQIPVNSIKGAIGHSLGAAGSFEAIMCARVIREGLIPPTAGCEQLDPNCPLDIVVGEARRRDVNVVLSTSSAFAGNNAAIVLRRLD